MRKPINHNFQKELEDSEHSSLPAEAIFFKQPNVPGTGTETITMQCDKNLTSNLESSSCLPHPNQLYCKSVHANKNPVPVMS